jgi:hypothetical protein
MIKDCVSRVTRTRRGHLGRYLTLGISMPSGIQVDCKLEQFSKALSPTLSRREPCSKVTEKSDVQWEKQFRPSILTLAGIQMDDKLEQCLKALTLILSSPESPPKVRAERRA